MVHLPWDERSCLCGTACRPRTEPLFRPFGKSALLPPQAAEDEGGAVPLDGELLADQAVAAIVPQVHRRLPAGDAEVVAVLRPPADRQLLYAGVLQLPGDVLAGVGVEQRHGLVVVLAGG